MAAPQKKIYIFIGSSITEFAAERMELENFIHRLSNDFEDKYNTRIIPVVCEAFDTAMALTRKQDEYNEAIKNSDMCFFLFYTRAGEYTVEEFRKAVETFRQNNRPKVYVYFKQLQPGTSVEQSLTDFMGEVDKTYKHFYSTFAYLDTVKLCLLLNIKLNAMDYLPIDVADGKCRVGGIAMQDIDLAKVTEFANSKDLKALQDELAQTEEKYLRMKPIYLKGGVDDDFYKEYAKVAARREKLKKDLEELRKATFELMLNINRNFAAGEISPRMKEAHRLLELGDKESCVKLLTEDENKNEYRNKLQEAKRLEKLATENRKNIARDYIREQRFAISVLKTMYSYAKRHEEIDRIYREIVAEAEENVVELDVLYDYAYFLWRQNQYNAALCYAEKLQNYYNDDMIKVSKVDIAKLNNVLGILYRNTQKLDKAEYCYLKSIKIVKKLITACSTTYEPELARSYNNLSILYRNTQRLVESEKILKKAICIYKRLVETNFTKYRPILAVNYNNLGGLYFRMHDCKRAEEYYKKALKIREQLSTTNSIGYEPDLATSYNNLGDLYCYIHKFDKAEEYLKNALRIRECLACANPEAYEPKLAITYNSIGNLYMNIQQFSKARQFFNKAINLLERLASINPTVYSKNLSDGYHNISELYKNTNQLSKAKKYSEKALSIREQLAKLNFDACKQDLARSYNILGTIHKNLQKFSDAETYFIKSLELRKQLVTVIPKPYEQDLAESYSNLGELYINTNRKAEAKEYYEKALEIYKRLESKNPGLYTDDVNDCEKTLQSLQD